MADENNGEVVPVPPTPPNKPEAVNPFRDVLSKPDRPMVCSFDLSTVEGRQLRQKCEEEPDKQARELVNLELKLQHVYAKVVDFTNQETGETYPLLRICLVTDEGKVHPCASEGVREGLWRLMEGHGFPPWKRPIKVVLQLKPLKNGHQRLALLEVFDKPKGAK